MTGSQVSADVTAHELKEHWFNAALRSASIDRDRWRPAAGVEENKQTIGNVYDYYGRMYANNPFLLWAGMASMIGPSFYAAFLDIGFIPDAMRRVAAAVHG